ncbi:Queuosine precursor transporter [Oligella sp. MSHR50489EDL]|uniref:VUT family protein n=1 Tax=Oligella sp. MSHR50489EDL TaxID=3139409 RepID=UPI003D815101
MTQTQDTQFSTMQFEPIKKHQRVIALAIMCALVAASNYFVQPQFHINDWLTLGAITYPVTFLVTDLMNRRFGPKTARSIVYWGFGAAFIVSVYLSTPRIALASGTAFLLAHILDIFVFHRLRQQAWWLAPLLAGVLASIIDTFVFFAVAFVGTGVSWFTLSLGDLAIKVSLSIMLLAPFRALMWNLGAAKIKKKMDVSSDGQAV